MLSSHASCIFNRAFSHTHEGGKDPETLITLKMLVDGPGEMDGSVVKNIGLCRGPRFNSKHPRSSSQMSVTVVPGDS